MKIDEEESKILPEKYETIRLINGWTEQELEIYRFGEAKGRSETISEMREELQGREAAWLHHPEDEDLDEDEALEQYRQDENTKLIFNSIRGLLDSLEQKQEEKQQSVKKIK